MSARQITILITYDEMAAGWAATTRKFDNENGER